MDGNKEHNILMYVRENILEAAAPFSGFRDMLHVVGIKDPLIPNFKIPLGPIPALSDIVFAAIGPAGGAVVSIDFEILLKTD